MKKECGAGWRRGPWQRHPRHSPLPANPAPTQWYVLTRCHGMPATCKMPPARPPRTATNDQIRPKTPKSMSRTGMSRANTHPGSHAWRFPICRRCTLHVDRVTFGGGWSTHVLPQHHPHLIPHQVSPLSGTSQHDNQAARAVVPVPSPTLAPWRQMGTQALPNQDPLWGALRPYAHLEAVTLHHQSHANVLRPPFPAGAPCPPQAAYLLTYIPSPGLHSAGGLESTGHIYRPKDGGCRHGSATSRTLLAQARKKAS